MNLTWRDMQHLVVRTSQPGRLSAGDWKTNGVGRRGKNSIQLLDKSRAGGNMWSCVYASIMSANGKFTKALF